MGSTEPHAVETRPDPLRSSQSPPPISPDPLVREFHRLDHRHRPITAFSQSSATQSSGVVVSVRSVGGENERRMRSVSLADTEAVGNAQEGGGGGGRSDGAEEECKLEWVCRARGELWEIRSLCSAWRSGSGRRAAEFSLHGQSERSVMVCSRTDPRDSFHSPYPLQQKCSSTSVETSLVPSHDRFLPTVPSYRNPQR